MDAETTLVAFLGKYHEMRKAEKQFAKTKDQNQWIRAMQLKLELDREKEQIIQELDRNPLKHG